MKENEKAITLAIGDGANDVSMIQGIYQVQSSCFVSKTNDARSNESGAYYAQFLLFIAVQRRMSEWAFLGERAPRQPATLTMPFGSSGT